MKFGIIGCGYVLDHYMSTLRNHPNLELAGVTDVNLVRSETVSSYYRTRRYPSNEALLADPEIELVLNLTPPKAHYEVIRASLLAGKHVYSEKPLTTDLQLARELVELADRLGLVLSGAPCNLLSDTIQTAWRALRSGAVGDARLVYAEFDDNPIYLMKPEGWKSKTGAPWPYRNEYEEGCTFEHAGYHLSWMCALFGPVESVTGFSKCLVPDKTSLPLDVPDTPDFSVACLTFRSGVVGRLTCSIVAPFDHRMRIIGDKGMLHIDTYRHYRAPVALERFSQLSLNARKARSVRSSPFLQALFGVGGMQHPLIRRQPTAPRKLRQFLNPKTALNTLKKRELGAQDKFLGVAEMASAIEQNRKCPLPPDFLLHITELTLAIQRSGVDGGCHQMTTTFEPLSPMPLAVEPKVARNAMRPGLLAALSDPLIARLHHH